ncbi:hypothetical protein ACFQ7O_24615 [Streptomyces sp. NPDC056485]|uniref:hypothetical protein n=1 Tax=Streptomyces sp. NPDC056485 TaxID=3345834 RepID=UPI00367D392C
MRHIIHRKACTATTVRAGRGRKQVSGAPDPVSRMLTDLAHYLLVPSTQDPLK